MGYLNSKRCCKKIIEFSGTLSSFFITWMADRWQKNERYLLMIQYQILFLNILNKCRIKSSNFCYHQIKYFLYFLISNDPLCTPTTYSFQKKELKLQCGTSRGGEAEPSIFSWLKGTFQFDWKIFLYFGWGKYDAYFKKILSKSQHCNNVFQILLPTHIWKPR